MDSVAGGIRTTASSLSKSHTGPSSYLRSVPSHSDMDSITTNSISRGTTGSSSHGDSPSGRSHISSSIISCDFYIVVVEEVGIAQQRVVSKSGLLVTLIQNEPAFAQCAIIITCIPFITRVTQELC